MLESMLQLSGGAPRVCGDDPDFREANDLKIAVLPAYAGMIRPHG